MTNFSVHQHEYGHVDGSGAGHGNCDGHGYGYGQSFDGDSGAGSDWGRDGTGATAYADVLKDSVTDPLLIEILRCR